MHRHLVNEYLCKRLPVLLNGHPLHDFINRGGFLVNKMEVHWLPTKQTSTNKIEFFLQYQLE